jgi:hypothetical protein
MAMGFKYLDFGGPVNFGGPVPLPRWHLAIDGPAAGHDEESSFMNAIRSSELRSHICVLCGGVLY